MRQRRTFSAKQKTDIVLSIIKNEATILEISRIHSITPSLLHKWKDNFLKNAHTAFEETNNETEKDKKIAKYEHIITKLTTQNDFLEKVLQVTR